MNLTIFLLVLHVFVFNLEAVDGDVTGNVIVIGDEVKVDGENVVKVVKPKHLSVPATGQFRAKGSVKILGSSCPGVKRPCLKKLSPVILPTKHNIILLPTYLPNTRLPKVDPNYIASIFASAPWYLLRKAKNSTPKPNIIFTNEYLYKTPKVTSTLRSNSEVKFIDTSYFLRPKAKFIKNGLC